MLKILPLLILFFFACSTGTKKTIYFSVSDPLKSDPTFLYNNGWLGGDSAYSIALSKHRILWLFGDSFVKKPDTTGKNERSGSSMVGNSIAIAGSEENNTSLKYYWNYDIKTDHHYPFFPPEKGYDKLWPKDGFVHKGKLYIILDKIENLKKEGAFAFQGKGSLLCIIDNPEEAPDKWSFKYFDLTADFKTFLSVSAHTDTNFAYLFSVIDDEDHKNHPIFLLRLSLSELKEENFAFEFFSKQGKWEKGINFEKAKIFFENGATEMSIKFHPEINRWVAIFNEPFFLTNKIVMRQATELFSDWSEEEVIYEFPEMKRDNKKFDKDTFCYAAKEHIETFSRDDGSYLVSYACNSFAFEKLVSNIDIYRPKLFRIKYIKSDGGKVN